MTVTNNSRFILVCAAALMGTVAYAGTALFWPQVLPFAGPLGYPPGGGIVGVPCQINHQGVVSVNGVRFSGTAKFYFAIVDPDAGLNRWTNDNTNIGNAGRPTTGVMLPVTNGMYSVRLGDNAAPVSMTPIASGIFADDNLRIRVWLDDMAGHGVQQLAPDQPLTSVPYAMRLPNVTVNDAGNVGIGTPTPAARLDVVGDAALLQVGPPENPYLHVAGESHPGKIMHEQYVGQTFLPPDGSFLNVIGINLPLRAGQTVQIVSIIRLATPPYQIDAALNVNGSYVGLHTAVDGAGHHTITLNWFYTAPTNHSAGISAHVRNVSGGGGAQVEGVTLQVVSMN